MWQIWTLQCTVGILPSSALSEYSYSSILYYDDATTIYFWTTTTTIINNKYAPKILLLCITVLIILTTDYAYVLYNYIICYQQKNLDVFKCLLHNCIFKHCYTTPGRAQEEGCHTGTPPARSPSLYYTLTLCSNNVLHFSSRYYKTLKKRHVNDTQELQVPPQAIGLLR